ncbi:MAG: aminomethyltransferase [Clostridiales bacterium]|nr:aminomethyltransferase [Clostridiales bacterium]
MEKKTPLYEMHVKYHGKIVPFAGYLLPVQYEAGIMKEHMAVRERVGIFDVSHMGEIICRGEDALLNLQQLLTNDFFNLEVGQARYSPMCNETGGTVDDLIVYKRGEQDYFIVVNAANKEKDYQWMKEHVFGAAILEDRSEQIAQIALQGPEAEAVLKKLTKVASIPQKYYYAKFDQVVAGFPCMISRTGYTGEDGFELYVDQKDAVPLWEALMEAGEAFSILPCGLGARDTLRLEAAMPLYGHEMNEEINPIEAGLSFAVKRNKGDFIGKSGLPRMEEVNKKRVGLKAIGRGILREGYPVFFEGKQVGITTSGTHLPYLGYAAAMALLDVDVAVPGNTVSVDVRGREVTANVVSLPFYKRK